MFSNKVSASCNKDPMWQRKKKSTPYQLPAAALTNHCKLETIEISLSQSGGQRPKVKVSAEPCSLGKTSSWPLPASGSSWHSLLHSHITPISASVFTQLLLYVPVSISIQMLLVNSRSTLIQAHLISILTFTIPAETLFPNEVTF